MYRSSSDAAGILSDRNHTVDLVGGWYQMEHRDGLGAGLTWLLVTRRGEAHIDHC